MRPQYPVARCCLLPAILREASNLYAMISALNGVFQCHRGQVNRGQVNVSGADFVVSWHTGDPFGVSGEFEVEVDDSSSDSCSSHCSGKHRLQPHSPPVLSSNRPITSPDSIRIAQGTAYGLANGVGGEVRDLWVPNERIVEAPAESTIHPMRTIDAAGLVVMPCGIDMQCHIAGPRRRYQDLHGV